MDAAQKRIDVLIAEDNRDLVAAVCAVISIEPDLHVAGTVERVGELERALQSLAVDVVVLDLNLGGESSLHAMRGLPATSLRPSVVVYSGYDRADLADALGTLGPKCEYVSKSGEPAELLAAIRRAAQTTTGAGD